MQGAASLASSLGGLVNAMARILEWWELRQMRLLEQADFEERRRIPWMYDMMHRWVLIHKGGTGVNLRASKFVAREADALMGALANEKKMAVPHAMLYDLEQMRDALRRLRALMGTQFKMLYNADYNLSSALSKSFEVSDAGLNLGYIEQLVDDPEDDWFRAVKEGDIKLFNTAVTQFEENPDSFTSVVFKISSEEKDEETGAPVDDWTAINGAIGVLGARVLLRTGVPSAIGVATAGYAIYRLVDKELKARDADRRHEFRELALFSAEVSRVEMLHRIWLILDGVMVQQEHGNLRVQGHGPKLQLSIDRPNEESQILAERTESLLGA
jgi:hypothetical protein